MPQIIERFKHVDLTTEVRTSFLQPDGTILDRSETVITEHTIDIYINERLTMKVVCSPEHLTELVLGRLISEGIIRSMDDIEQLYLCESGHRAKVTLTDHSRNSNPDFLETTPTCCTGNRIINGDFSRYRDLRPVEPIPWKPDWFFSLANRFDQGMPLHDLTRSTHSCFLAVGDSCLFSCEDIGRHNALDKAIGYALRNGIDLHRCILYTSGRVPVDMIEKVIRTGVPLFGTKSNCSADAAALAAQYNLTLVGLTRKSHFSIYNQAYA